MHYSRQETSLLSVYLQPGLGHWMPDIVYLETFPRLIPQTVAMKFAWTGIHQQLKNSLWLHKPHFIYRHIAGVLQAEGVR